MMLGQGGGTVELEDRLPMKEEEHLSYTLTGTR
jgi:hypothetical protein